MAQNDVSSLKKKPASESELSELSKEASQEWLDGWKGLSLLKSADDTASACWEILESRADSSFFEIAAASLILCCLRAQKY